jgi:succinate dehydrogenase / fumarate reductase, membrane anchor subunit
MDNSFVQEPKATAGWLWQVITGVGLVFPLGLHIITNHFIAKGGLHNFADVLAYLRNPVFLVLEVLFLVVVASHAMLGIRAILMDFGLSDRVEKLVSRALTIVGVLTVCYGMWLTWAIVH